MSEGGGIHLAQISQGSPGTLWQDGLTEGRSKLFPGPTIPEVDVGADGCELETVGLVRNHQSMDFPG